MLQEELDTETDGDEPPDVAAAQSPGLTATR